MGKTIVIVTLFLILSIQFQTAFPKDNDQIKKIYPSMNDSIPIGTNTMNMTFSRAVESTVPVNISIYLKHDDTNLLRQIFLCSKQNCVIGDDDDSLTIVLLDITFNVPNATYYVEIDDDFLKYKDESEMITGIKLGNWIIKTTGEYNKTNDDSEIIYGVIRLNIEGTQYYKNLKDDTDDTTYFDGMIKQISESIPVDLLRLHYSRHYLEFDNEELLYMIFRINPPIVGGFNNKSTKDVFDDFYKLLKINSEIKTYLDLKNHTKYIDKIFGLRKASNLWEEIKIKLLYLKDDKVFLSVFIFSLVLLVILTLGGYYLNKDANNLIIFQAAFTLFDIANDIIFLFKLKNNLHDLLIPSIIFTIVPFLVNLVLAIYILKHENNYNIKFKNWFDKNLKLASAIVVFCVGDVGLLHLLDSKFANLEIFEAPFQNEHLIFRGLLLNVIIEDISQLVIQILYAIAITTTEYSDIALLTLITSFVMVFINVVCFAFGIILKKHKKRREANNIDSITLNEARYPTHMDPLHETARYPITSQPSLITYHEIQENRSPS
ncbi:3250_t:CDS:10, partial [Funneliformis mosseae]